MSIRLQVQAKRPGLKMVLNPVDMVFDYKGTYPSATPEAYETLLLDVIQGDQTLFMRGDQVEAAWELIMPIINTWENKAKPEFPKLCCGYMGAGTCRSLDRTGWLSLVYPSS
jgi:glucose-6-phosphate 1-dehydrogenase